MLSNAQIQTHLENLGFALIPPKNPQNYKVLQFKHPNLESSIYVKNANRLPLVVHGNYERVRSEALKISGVESDSVKPLYFNSNMKDFDKQRNTGQNPEHFGLHFGFDSTPALEKFLSLINSKPMVSTSPTAVEDSLTAQNQTERDALIKARIGQGKYREALKAYWNGCAVTGCTVDALLVSSHIKPWSVDKEARLDVYNGLLLSPTLDLAFDKGLISFDDDGLIMLSPELSEDDLQRLHLNPSLKLRKIESQHHLYLEWHRSNLFRA
jgi:putative restriction endonuclease